MALSVSASSASRRLGAVVAADQYLGREAGGRLEPVREARGERIEFGAGGAHEDGEARQAGIAVEQRHRQPELRQTANGHRIGNELDADLAALMVPGKAREAVGRV